MFDIEQNNLFNQDPLLPFNANEGKEAVISELNKVNILSTEEIPHPTPINLDTIFPEQEISDKNVKILKNTLGILADNYSPEELHLLATKIEFLVESWLDEYERNIFNGKTLKELLHEGSKI